MQSTSIPFLKKYIGLISFISLALLLTACPAATTTPTPTPTASLTVSPVSTTAVVGGGAIAFTATLTGSSDSIAWAASGTAAGTLSTATGTVISWSPPTTGSGGTATLTATAGTLTASATITVTGNPASITNVSIQGNGTSTEVRQGAGTIILDVTGTNIGGISIAKLGDLNGTIGAGAGPSAAQITFTIPAGAPIGAKTLDLTLASGPVKKDASVTITKITAGPTGSDTTGKGTNDSPFRTLTKANGETTVDAGDIVFLKNGTYNRDAGETFPVDISGITLEGESQAGTIIDGTSPSSSSGLETDQSTTSISKLTVQNFGAEGIFIQRGTLTLSEVTSTKNDFGFLMNGNATVTITKSTFSANGTTGVSAFTGSKTVGKLTITDSAITANGFVGGVFEGLAIDELGELDLSNVSITNNGSHGLAIGEFSQGSNLIKIRNSTITGNAGDGFRIFKDPAVIDLGKPTIPGNPSAEVGSNTIKDNGALSFSINDQRPSTTVELWSNGNDLGGTGAPETGKKTGATSSQQRYNITTAGNVINFGP